MNLWNVFYLKTRLCRHAISSALKNGNFTRREQMTSIFNALFILLRHLIISSTFDSGTSDRPSCQKCVAMKLFARQSRKMAQDGDGLGALILTMTDWIGQRDIFGASMKLMDHNRGLIRKGRIAPRVLFPRNSFPARADRTGCQLC